MAGTKVRNASRRRSARNWLVAQTSVAMEFQVGRRASVPARKLGEDSLTSDECGFDDFNETESPHCRDRSLPRDARKTPKKRGANFTAKFTASVSETVALVFRRANLPGPADSPAQPTNFETSRASTVPHENIFTGVAAYSFRLPARN